MNSCQNYGTRIQFTLISSEFSLMEIRIYFSYYFMIILSFFENKKFLQGIAFNVPTLDEEIIRCVCRIKLLHNFINKLWLD